MAYAVNDIEGWIYFPQHRLEGCPWSPVFIFQRFRLAMSNELGAQAQCVVAVSGVNVTRRCQQENSTETEVGTPQPRQVE